MPKKSKETLEFNAKTSKVLKMMINSVYTNADVFIRELVANAADAIEKRRYLVLTDGESFAPDGDYEIIINLDEEKKTISIKDNGIGMTKEDIIKNLGTIAESGTENFLKNMSDENKLIGRFGVGFYSAFIVADSVKVISKKVGSDKGYVWESEGEDSYTIDLCKEVCYDGTEVILKIKDSCSEYLDKFKLRYIMETYTNSLDVNIKIQVGDDIDNVKTKEAIWHSDPKSLTEEAYEDFYRSLSSLPGKPLFYIHYNAEGTIEFKSILFIPSMKPYDLFNPDRKTKIGLYVKKVFITDDNIDIIPKYLRFIYGVVESDDLPLNISRESLQDNRVVKKISDILVKKIFAEILKFRKENPEEYLEFWQNFGNALKEGLCEMGDDYKKQIFENALFYTSKSSDKPISLEEYIDRMPESQKDIYYCISDTIENALSSPQIEAFTHSDKEVILLVDVVDGFWTNVVNRYNGKDFKSISSSDVRPDTEKANQDSDKEGNKKDTDKKTESNENEDDTNKDEIVQLITKALKGKVKEVRISKKLTESPACLAVASGNMDISMERFLIEQQQLKKGALKILEVNPNNELITKCVDKLKEESSFEDGKNLAQTIFDIACIAQGERLESPGVFAKRLNNLLKDNIA